MSFKLTTLASFIYLFAFNSIGHSQDVRTGSFVAFNPSIYAITGTVEMSVDATDGLTVKFKNDFATVQGVKLEVFLSTDAEFSAADDIKISTDPIGQGVPMGVAITGPRTFVVSDSVSLDQYDNVLVQCTSFGVLWGHAELSGSQGNGNGGNMNGGGTTNTWTVIDVDEGEKPTLTIDNNGVPHIAFIDETNPGFIKIAQLDGNSFESTLVDEGYFYGPVDLAFTPTNRARIAYHDHNTNGGDYALANELPTGQYDIEYIESSGHDGWDNTIFIEDDGTEHLLSTGSSGEGVEYARVVNGEWTVENVGIGNTMYKWATDIVVVDDIVYAVAFETSTGNLILARRTNGNWSTEIVTDGGRFPSLSVDDSGDIMVAYFKEINNSSGYVGLGHRGTVGWEHSIIDTLISYDNGNARNIVKLFRNPWATLISYTDTDVFKLATLSLGSDSWNIETVLDYTNDDRGLRNQAAMDIDSEGFIHLSTYRKEATAAGGGVIMYMTNQELSDGGGMMETQKITRNIELDIKDAVGNALPQADIVITSTDGLTDINQTAFGQYALSALETSEDDIRICASLNSAANENISAVDVVRALNIVLDKVEPCPANVIAADVDESGQVSVVDLVQILNVAIGKSESFSNNPSWLFMFNDEVKTCEVISLSSLPSQLEITGIKKGNLECTDPLKDGSSGINDGINWKH